MAFLAGFSRVVLGMAAPTKLQIASIKKIDQALLAVLVRITESRID